MASLCLPGLQIKRDAFIYYLNSNNSENAITNILVTNIRNAHEDMIYRETAGPRSGKGTIYEMATVEPFMGPFGSVEYFKMLWRRTENQTIGD